MSWDSKKIAQNQVRKGDGEIANFEEISEITVKRTIKQIRQDVEDGFNREDIMFDNVFNLRKRLNSIKLGKVS